MCNILVDKRDLNVPCGKMDVNGRDIGRESSRSMF
jgi:hypothetical protein